MKKLIKEHWFESVLGIIILALLIVVIKTQNESGKVNKQNLDLQTKVYNLPTATEVFNLRSECATLGQKISEKNKQEARIDHRNRFSFMSTFILKDQNC